MHLPAVRLPVRGVDVGLPLLRLPQALVPHRNLRHGRVLLKPAALGSDPGLLAA